MEDLTPVTLRLLTVEGAKLIRAVVLHVCACCVWCGVGKKGIKKLGGLSASIQLKSFAPV